LKSLGLAILELGLVADGVDPRERQPHVDEAQQRDELLVHLAEHEVERASDVDVLDLTLDRGLLAGLDLARVVIVDLYVALGRGLRGVLGGDVGYGLAELLARGVGAA
jgi:hypothetical protein